MKDFLTIGGVEYRVEVNWNTICDFLDLRGYKLADLSKMADFSANDVSSLLWCAIIEGERLEGRKCELDIKDMGAAIGPDDINNFLVIFQKQYVGKGSSSEDSSKKKVSHNRRSSRR